MVSLAFLIQLLPKSLHLHIYELTPSEVKTKRGGTTFFVGFGLTADASVSVVWFPNWRECFDLSLLPSQQSFLEHPGSISCQGSRLGFELPEGLDKRAGGRAGKGERGRSSTASR